MRDWEESFSSLHFSNLNILKFMAIGDCIKNCPTAGCPDKKTLKVVIPNFDLPALSVFSSFLAAVLRG